MPHLSPTKLATLHTARLLSSPKPQTRSIYRRTALSANSTMSSVSRTLFMGGRRALSARSFHSSARRMADATPLPSKKPMGAFRGGLFGFLFGCVMSGGGVYSYLLQEYKASNDLLTEDIYTLQASVTRLSNYVKNIEEKTKK